jgi:hypothetical protein
MYFKVWIFPIIFYLFLTATIFYLREKYDLIGLSDSFFVLGIIGLSITLLQIIVRTGVYDVMGYGLSSFKDAIFLVKKQYHSPNDYRDKKELKRKNNPINFIPKLVIFITFIFIALVISQIALN